MQYLCLIVNSNNCTSRSKPIAVCSLIDVSMKLTCMFDFPKSFPAFFTCVHSKNDDRIRLNHGLMGRLIAYVSDPVVFVDGSESDSPLHERADGANVIAKEDGTGYYYVSNSEKGDVVAPTGGAYVIETDLEHNPVDYYQVLGGTMGNCAGDRSTPWGTFVSCEESRGFGCCWQSTPPTKTRRVLPSHRLRLSLDSLEGGKPLLGTMKTILLVVMLPRMPSLRITPRVMAPSTALLQMQPP
jgi:hypothetical protein